jgi:hypothetical protein
MSAKTSNLRKGGGSTGLFYSGGFRITGGRDSSRSILLRVAGTASVGGF